MRAICLTSVSRLAMGVGAALIAGSASAAPPPPVDWMYAPTSITGDLSGGLGWVSLSSVSTGFATVGGRLNIPLSSGWNLEPDFGIVDLFNPSVATLTGVAHLYKSLPNAAVGVFGGGSFAGAPVNSSSFTVGAEAAFYGHPNSILGIGAAFTGGSSSFPSVNAYWDYFFTPDLKSTIDLSWVGGAIPVTTLSAAVTNRFSGTPWSVFASGGVGFTNVGTGYFGLVGVTWNFDAPGTTLYDHDRAVPFTYASTKF